jgi:hypothetical protein
MDWIRAVFSGENSAITLVVIVVGLALALVLLAWVFRKIAGDGSIKAGRNRQPRLSVTDAAIVDDKRRLVLVRRDNVEHLVMIGGPSDVVIEQNIYRAMPAQQVSDAAAKSRAAEKQREARRPPAPVARPVTQPVAEPETAHASIAEAAATPPPQVAARHSEPVAQQAVPQIAELELSEEQLAAEIAASEELAAAEAAAISGSANGHPAAPEASEAEIEIDLAELQSEIERSQENVEPQPARAVVQPRHAVPPLDGADLEAVTPSRKSPDKAARAETRQEPKLPAETANRSASRVKNMEDEMQRLLEELSGPARN